jgi:NDP-sugar pyrophosphorylase family protein
MQVVILAGGLGTRLGAVTRTLPKPMVPVRGVPYLEHQLRLLARHGLTDIVLLTGYLGEQIEEDFGDGGRLGLRIRYSREPQPLGTGGALREANTAGRVLLVIYGDSYLRIDYAAGVLLAHRLQLWRFHSDPFEAETSPPNVGLDRNGAVLRYDEARRPGGISKRACWRCAVPCST